MSNVNAAVGPDASALLAGGPTQARPWDEAALAARTVALPEEIDLGRVDQVFGLLDMLACDGGAALILDMRPTQFIDSQGLVRLLQLGRLCREAGQAMVVITSAELERRFRRFRVDQFLTLARDEHEARRALASPVALAAL